ncbi:GntR family transcriptional regulator [Sinomonas sp. JGH33]|uniref:GntR family transcriptional regulator n=1 Tax=Sinomonas terricola TaxID=3110330 RepID=A0ABU5T644_9MICC|nr:GntR family transcriptional regulator [Sinomonas sp. JGH33]MEA5455125.1 GntR family transcriptional regulator [Sinomonas sp. JGH33]
MLQPIVQESTPSLIAAQLRGHIAEGALPPGAQLVEADIARELGVSRGPIREAIQRLTQEGLLVSIRNRGVFVAEFDDEDIRDIYEARTAVEKAAAGILADGDGARAGAELLRQVERMDAARAAGDDTAVSEADIAFHEKLVEMAASPRLSKMHATLLTETRMCLNRLQGRYDDESVRVEEHRGIAEAIRDGKRDLVMDRLDAHKDDAIARLLPIQGANSTAAS